MWSWFHADLVFLLSFCGLLAVLPCLLVVLLWSCCGAGVALLWSWCDLLVALSWYGLWSFVILL